MEIDDGIDVESRRFSMRMRECNAMSEARSAARTLRGPDNQVTRYLFFTLELVV